MDDEEKVKETKEKTFLDMLEEIWNNYNIFIIIGLGLILVVVVIIIIKVIKSRKSSLL